MNSEPAKRQRPPRTKIAEGIWKDKYGYSVLWRDRGRQREKRFPLDTPLPNLKAFRQRQEKMAMPAAAVDQSGVRTGSFVRDVVRYLRSRKGRPSYKADRSHLRPWAKRFGRFSRHAITRDKIAEALADWHDKSPRELRHRVNVLRQVFNLLDGPDVRNPCEGVKQPTIAKTRPKGVPDEIIQTVALNLVEQERKGRLRDAKTRARFAVLASCGKRPCQVMRARRNLDVNFTTRIWDVEPAKNSHGGPLYLNDEMLAAWKLFDEADAWGDYDPVSFAKTLRRNGWPAGVRPYNMRHQTLQTMSNEGVDFGAIQQAAGHASPDTTRRAYVPHEIATSRRASEAIEGRFAPAMFGASPVDSHAAKVAARRLVPGPVLPAAPAGSTPGAPPDRRIPHGSGPVLPADATSGTPNLNRTKVENTKDFHHRPRLVKRASGGQKV
jgi:integrase